MSSIFYGQTQQSLLAGDGWDGVDYEASHRRYCERLADRIDAAYPGVEVEVGTRSDFRHADGFIDADEELERVAAIAEQLFDEPDEWVVELAEPEPELVPYPRPDGSGYDWEPPVEGDPRL